MKEFLVGFSEIEVQHKERRAVEIFRGWGGNFQENKNKDNNTVSFLSLVKEQRDFGSGKIEGFSEE